MATFGTDEFGNALPFELSVPEDNTALEFLPTVTVAGTSSDDRYVAQMPSQYLDGMQDGIGDVTATLGQGIDIADYSALPPDAHVGVVFNTSFAGEPSSSVISENYVEVADGIVPDPYEVSFDEITGAEAFIGTPNGDDFIIGSCNASLTHLDGGGFSSSGTGYNDGLDSLSVRDDIGPVEWQIGDDGAGRLTGQGLYINFENIQELGIRPGDVVNGDRIPGVPPAEMTETMQNCDPLEVSQFLREAETEFAANETPTVLEAHTLAALRDSALADRVEAMAYAGIETVEVPIRPDLPPIEQVVITANAAEAATLAHETSVARDQHVPAIQRDNDADYAFG